MHRKKILIAMLLSDPSGEKFHGGVDAVCQDLVKGLLTRKGDQNEYRLVGFSPAYDASFKKGKERRLNGNITLKLYNYHCNRESLFAKLLPNFVWHNRIIRAEAARFRPDVLHVHLFSWLLRRYAGIKTVLTFHSYKKVARKSIGFLNDLLYVSILPRLAIRNADRVTSVSMEIIDQVKSLKNDAEYVANPVNRAYFEVKRSGKSLTGFPSLVMTGSVQPRKRTLDALKVVFSLKSKYPDVKLYLVGPDNLGSNYFRELDAFIERNALRTNVEFLGVLSVHEICALYSKTRAGIFLSENETFGLAPLEMMAAGLPVVLTEVGAALWYRQKFEQTGIRKVPVGDIEAIVRMCSVIFDERTVIDDRAKNFIQQDFTPDKILNDYEYVYEK